MLSPEKSEMKINFHNCITTSVTQVIEEALTQLLIFLLLLFVMLRRFYVLPELMHISDRCSPILVWSKPKFLGKTVVTDTSSIVENGCQSFHSG
jgi:hypothetical protein